MTEELQSQKITITPSTGVQRFAADVSLAFDLGRDLEIAHLVRSPKILAESKTDEGEGYALDNSLTELCRIRMSPANGVVLALHILDEISDSGKLNTESLRQSVEKIIAKNNEKRDDVE
jgi:hypothetical protein|tara:strand:- start:331 stop:687 length:357 start_codon:yes stop_codon:yes gene_type:complete